MLINNNELSNVTKAAAEIMTRLRPDLYDVDKATATLRSWMDDMSGQESTYGIGTGGFELVKNTDGGFELMLKLADWNWFDEPDSDQSFGGTIWKPEWVYSPIEDHG